MIPYDPGTQQFSFYPKSPPFRLVINGAAFIAPFLQVRFLPCLLAFWPINFLLVKMCFLFLHSVLQIQNITNCLLQMFHRLQKLRYPAFLNICIYANKECIMARHVCCSHVRSFEPSNRSVSNLKDNFSDLGIPQFEPYPNISSHGSNAQGFDSCPSLSCFLPPKSIFLRWVHKNTWCTTASWCARHLFIQMMFNAETLNFPTNFKNTTLTEEVFFKNVQLLILIQPCASILHISNAPNRNARSILK